MLNSVPRTVDASGIGAVLFRLVQDALAGLTPHYWHFWVGVVLIGRERIHAGVVSMLQPAIKQAELAFIAETARAVVVGPQEAGSRSRSLARGAAKTRARLQPSSKAQRLVFLGTYWSGGADLWGVEREFEKLAFATRTIGNFLSFHFVDVVDSTAVERELERGASILHYAGHTDTDTAGSYLVREADDHGGSMFWYAKDVGRACADAKTRLAVFSACNSGAWGFVQPILKSGVPAVVGVQGAIESRSSIEFCDKLYAALAVGLSLDEASTYARLHVVHAGTLPCDLKDLDPPEPVRRYERQHRPAFRRGVFGTRQFHIKGSLEHAALDKSGNRRLARGTGRRGLADVPPSMWDAGLRLVQRRRRVRA